MTAPVCQLCARFRGGGLSSRSANCGRFPAAGQPDSHARFWTHRWILAATADSHRTSVGRGFYDVGARNDRHDKAGERSAVEWSKLHPAADIDAGSQPDQRSAEFSRRQSLGRSCGRHFHFSCREWAEKPKPPGHGDVENAPRFPHPHTPDDDYGQLSNEALH